MNKKKSFIIISVLIITALTFILCFGSIKNGTALSSEFPKTKVILDAGHGGIDAGVSGVNTGVKESELNLMIVKKLERYLVDAGFEVRLTRSTDAGLYGLATTSRKKKDMEKRRQIIEKFKPNLVVSVHLNKYSLSTRRGAQVFFNEESENGKILAEHVQSAFNELEESTRSFSALRGDYYMLKCTEYPSIIAECGYLSNPEEEKLLLTEEYQGKIAYSIFKGIVGYVAQTTITE